MNKSVLGLALLLAGSSAFSMSCPSVKSVYAKLVKVNGLNAPVLYCTNTPHGGEYDGASISVNAGDLKNIHEAAIVLGHELAHMRTYNELGADKIGAEYASRAGYNVCVGAAPMKYWPADPEHPSGAVRYKRLGCS